jgi:hypothetical protein
MHDEQAHITTWNRRASPAFRHNLTFPQTAAKPGKTWRKLATQTSSGQSGGLAAGNSEIGHRLPSVTRSRFPTFSNGAAASHRNPNRLGTNVLCLPQRRSAARNSSQKQRRARDAAAPDCHPLCSKYRMKRLVGSQGIQVLEILRCPTYIG